MEPIQKIKGFADLFGPDSRAMAFIETIAGRVFGRYGYQELRLPILERTELFQRSIGEGTDVVQKEMYTFADRKGRSLTLRPEATAGVMRACIENKIIQPGQVVKLFSYGPMFRYERPQKGRMRQFHQINAECLGPLEPQADAEVIMMLMAFLTELKLENLDLQINNLGCAACRPVYLDTLRTFLMTLDGEQLCADCLVRRQTNPLRVLDCKVPSCRQLTMDAPSIAASACPDCQKHFRQVLKLLDLAGRTYSLNPRLVRGLDYYVRTTFEVVSGEIGAQSSVAGGGRYDGLVRGLGGPDVPGLGFACGMERLALLLPPTPTGRTDFYLAPLEEAAVEVAWDLAEKLRAGGLQGICAFAGHSLKAHLKQADRLGATRTIIIGPDELAGGQVLVRDMLTGQQAYRSLEQARAGHLD